MANQVFGSSIASTQVWDVSAIYALEDVSPQVKELLVRMYQNLNLMALAINAKQSGYYPTQPFVNGSAYFPQPLNTSYGPSYAALRPGQHFMILTGPLPNTGTLSVPHNIFCTGAISFTKFVGCATDPVGFNYIPLPYSSCTAVADNVEINADANNVNIITGSNRSNFTIVYIYIEYLSS